MEIPKTLLAYYLNESGFSSYVNYQKTTNYLGVSYSNSGFKPLFRFNPISKKHRNKKSKLRSIRYYHYNNLKEERGEISIKSLENNGFVVSLNLGKTESRSSESLAVLELDHPTFKDLPVQPYISISYTEFRKLLQSCNGCIEDGGKLPGTYKICIETTGASPNYSFVREDISTLTTDLYTKLGEVMESTKRTRDWKLGHIYAIKDSIFLYLGRIDSMDVIDISYYFGNSYTKPYFPIYSFIGTKNYVDWRILRLTEDSYTCRKDVIVGINLSKFGVDKLLDIIYHISSKSGKISVYDLILEVFTKTNELCESTYNRVLSVICLDNVFTGKKEQNYLAYDLGKYIELEPSSKESLKAEIDKAILNSLNILFAGKTNPERANERILYYLLETFPDQVDKEKYKGAIYNHIAIRFNSLSKYLYNLTSVSGLTSRMSLGKQLGNTYRIQYKQHKLNSSGSFNIWSNDYELLEYMKNNDIPFLGKFSDADIDNLLECSYTILP